MVVFKKYLSETLGLYICIALVIQCIFQVYSCMKIHSIQVIFHCPMKEKTHCTFSH